MSTPVAGSMLPVVDPSTARSCLHDILFSADVEQIEDESGEGDALTDQIMAIAAENRQVMQAVQTMAQDESRDFQMGALLGMAVTYNVLRAQIEVNALKGMAAV